MSMLAIEALFTHPISIHPGPIAATTNGASIDLSNATSNELVIIPGTWTDGTHTFSIQDSPDNATWTTNSTDIVGGFTPISGSGTAVVSKCSYIGVQRYIRIVSTVVGATTGAVYAAIAVLGQRKLPAAL